MLAHWLLWQGKPLSNRNNDEADDEFVRVVNSMRQQNESLDNRWARNAYVVFQRRYSARVSSTNAGAIGLPLPDQLATFMWLTRMPGVSDRAEVNDRVVATMNALMQRNDSAASKPTGRRER
jgi:hypothetical protein